LPAWLRVTGWITAAVMAPSVVALRSMGHHPTSCSSLVARATRYRQYARAFPDEKTRQALRGV
jgi:hypothetical protein